jgi:DNA polymerase-3 subunit gamma/tau
MDRQLPLTLKHRPRSFADLTGQAAVRVVLQQMVKRDKVPSAMLLTGPRGTGKTTVGRIMAAALNCEVASSDKPCGLCAHCKAIFAGNSMTVIEQDAASNGVVDDIRGLKDRLLYSTDGLFYVVILDEAHSMSNSAFNALLKVLEEPPPNTVFILITTEPKHILETVRSRCMEFTFKRISNKDIASRLQHICDAEGFSVEPQLLTAIASRSDGGLRDAVMTLDQMTSVGVKTVESFRKLLGESDFAPPLLVAMSTADLPQAFQLVNEQLTRSGDPSAITQAVIECLRDVMVLRSGGTTSWQDEQLISRTNLTRIPMPNLFGACRILWELNTKFKASEDPRSALDLAIVLITEQLSQNKLSSAPVTPKTPPQKLSLSDMKL